MRRYEAMLPRAGVPQPVRASDARLRRCRRHRRGTRGGRARLLDSARSVPRARRQDGIATTTFGSARSPPPRATSRRRDGSGRRAARSGAKAEDPLGGSRYWASSAGWRFGRATSSAGSNWPSGASTWLATRAGGCGSPQRQNDLAEGQLAAGRTDAGELHAREAMALGRAGAAAGHRIRALLLGWAAHQRGDLQRAAVLWASVEAEHARSPIQRWDRHRDRHRARLPEDLPPAAALPSTRRWSS